MHTTLPYYKKRKEEEEEIKDPARVMKGDFFDNENIIISRIYQLHPSSL
jgi:hypothetical protein